MHILYVSQYFPPEMGAPAARVHELSCCWVQKGHRVTVLTAFPNHPDGKVPENYKRSFRRGSLVEQINGIRVVRTWLYPAPNRRSIERILNYSSFFLSACLRGTFLSRPDVVIATSPQLLVGLVGWWLSLRFRRPFVLEIRDLWPESLPASGVSRIDSPLYRGLEALARFLYRAADLIVPVTSSFCERIGARAPGVKMTVVENGVDMALFGAQLDRDENKEKLGLSGRFVVSYIGTIGFAHGLGTVLEAAAQIKTSHPEVTFLFVGEGAERKKLEKQASILGLDNVRFAGQHPRSEMPGYIAASDVCLVLLRRSELFETVLPSKMLEFMGCGRPVILGVGGLSRAIIEESGGGIPIVPEDSRQLADAVARLYADRRLGEELGRKGRDYISKRFSRKTKARAYLEALEGLVRHE